MLSASVNSPNRFACASGPVLPVTRDCLSVASYHTLASLIPHKRGKVLKQSEDGGTKERVDQVALRRWSPLSFSRHLLLEVPTLLGKVPLRIVHPKTTQKTMSQCDWPFFSAD
jgi:hypothetical protein